MYAYFDFVPEFMCSAPCRFHTSCFGEITVDWRDDISTNSPMIHVELADKTSWFCEDTVVFGTLDRFQTHTLAIHGSHTVSMAKWHDLEKDYVEKHGISVFWFKHGIMRSLSDLLQTYELFRPGANRVSFH